MARSLGDPFVIGKQVVRYFGADGWTHALTWCTMAIETKTIVSKNNALWAAPFWHVLCTYRLNLRRKFAALFYV
jgi:hypothetical protein